jgi:hypothetical protein
MLQKLADHIAAAKAMAAEAEERAQRASSAFDRDDNLERAKAWRHVVASYEFVVALERFLIDAHRNAWPVRVDELPKPPMLNEKRE